MRILSKPHLQMRIEGKAHFKVRSLGKTQNRGARREEKERAGPQGAVERGSLLHSGLLPESSSRLAVVSYVFL